MTTTGTTTLVGEKAEARDSETMPEMVKPAFAVAAGHVAPWADPQPAIPETSPVSVLTEPPVTPGPIFSQAALPNPGLATTPTAPFVSLGAPSQALPRPKGPGTQAAPTATISGDDEETTTTIITTTTITTVPVPGEGSAPPSPRGPTPPPCIWNLTGPEGFLESPEPVSSPYDSLDCTYSISGYPGYGVEIQVQNISLLEGETVAVEAFGGVEPVVLANESFLMRGQVIRSPINRVSVRFQSPQPAGPGTFRFHFQGTAYLLSCRFPSRPAYGYVSVTSLHPGGTAHFSCTTGYQLQGPPVLTCLNATRPFWSSQEPVCVAACGGVIRNATIGHIISPGFPGNYSNNLTCHWLLEAPESQRLHLHFEKVSLAEDDDRCGAGSGSPPLGLGAGPAKLGSAGPLYRTSAVGPPLILSPARLRIGKDDILTFYDGDDLTARILGQYSGPHRRFKLYTAMADVTIQFQSDPGSPAFAYQQGFVIHFFEVPRNDTCPELPEIPNGWKTTSHPELIHGTVVNYHCYPGFEIVGTDLLMCHWDLTWSGDLPACERVTSCKDPGDVDHSRRIISSPKFPVGSTVQFVCDKGYVLTGGGLLTCHDRQAGGPKWSDRLPKCTLYEPCHNPGAPENGVQRPERRLYPAGTTLRFSCAAGYLLLGEVSLRCVPGHPSQWNSAPPSCKVSPSGNALEGINVAVAVFLPVVVVALLVGAIYLYFSR
uniref:Seizure related 6 homolog n=1 Tax=Pelusios castaneus TaxID=367368 RepID=A0A8C8S7D4_9SAUR